ncbi:hypothetical protein Q9Q94_09970 [Uliginosibacterium sp. 31-16]|uniref:hypothetical protein n=1 Tax=Uliginosibacterium sp. 31-16 TaxID=3068315 RepID=UPI00273F1429|nr:hypothetical protein [Uliginosibacterium sp. 31-16]MDP5239860.1 hypothetical protein [Uliginosibacterium sp. 31-16]
MLQTAIYCKTHKGAEEIATRAHHLPSRLRSTLILIDGHTPWNELCKRLMIGEAAEAAVQTLLAEGFVQSIDDEPPTVIEM